MVVFLDETSLSLMDLKLSDEDNLFLWDGREVCVKFGFRIVFGIVYHNGSIVAGERVDSSHWR